MAIHAYSFHGKVAMLNVDNIPNTTAGDLAFETIGLNSGPAESWCDQAQTSKDYVGIDGDEQM